MGKIKRFLKSHPKIMRVLFSIYNALPFNNKVKGRHANTVNIKGMRKKCRIKIRGKNNTVEIEEGVILKNCTVTVSGNNNRIVFGEKSYAHFADVYTEDSNNSILIGK